MKRQTSCFVTLGFLLGLGTLGCTEPNPAFHKSADGGRSQDTKDTPANADRSPTDGPPKDVGDGPDTRQDAGDSLGLVDGEVGSEWPDALGLDGRAEAGPDTKSVKDAKLDTGIADGKDGPSYDLPPANPDVEHPDTRALAKDTADAPLELDGPEGNAGEVGNVFPDAEGPRRDAPDPDSQH